MGLRRLRMGTALLDTPVQLMCCCQRWQEFWMTGGQWRQPASCTSKGPGCGGNLYSASPLPTLDMPTHLLPKSNTLPGSSLLSHDGRRLSRHIEPVLGGLPVGLTRIFAQHWIVLLLPCWCLLLPCCIALGVASGTDSRLSGHDVHRVSTLIKRFLCVQHRLPSTLSCAAALLLLCPAVMLCCAGGRPVQMTR